MARPPEADLPLFREKRVNDPEKALKLVRVEARGCTRCDLYKNATQAVFGEGPADASLMLIGEQPGDQEDLAGLPFVGPAGKVLDNEIDLVQPAVAVALGATAARGLMRKALSINANRGRLIALPGGVQGLITVHPSYLLRLQEARDKRREFDLLAKDLRIANDAARRARR